MCNHHPASTEANDGRCWEARVVADHPEQGWAKLCNGVIVFDDGMFLVPDGRVEEIPTLAA
jgi:hypothetical protein